MSTTVDSVRPAYDFSMRWFGGMWFLLLAVLIAFTAPATTSVEISAKSCLVLFDLILGLLILVRPPAVSQAKGILPRVTAFVGTYVPWTIPFFPHTDYVLPNLLSSVCLVGGMFLMIVTIISLGNAFSIVPQARKVVRTGPYRWIRHPLYLAEQIAILGTLLQFLSPVTMAIFVAHITVQVCRMRYEERLLCSTFPEYRAYQASSWRLIPFVW
jgi:protein-S-isoprenylcysteine O-methyltransferase Ste14